MTLSTKTTNPPASPSSGPPPLETLISTHDFAAVAEATFPPKAKAFVFSAATDMHTHRRNNTAYSKIGLRPRILRDVSGPADLRTTLLGHVVTSPIFASPTSLGKTVHSEGEREIGRACKSLGVAQVVSTSASFTLEEVVQAISETPGPLDGAKDGANNEHGIPVFFQLYVDKDRRKTEALLASAANQGIKALFLTVDSPVVGKREADERLQVTSSTTTTPNANPSPSEIQNLTPAMTNAVPISDSHGGGLGRITGKFLDASMSWGADIAWLRRCLPPGTPIVLKGIQTAMDAIKAMEAGVEGIVVSNHGGRSLDTSPASILVLLELQRCCPEVFDAMEVFVDGGVMRGTDVFKALCLGAKGVGIGRGVLYGLGPYGRRGVERVVQSELRPLFG